MDPDTDRCASSDEVRTKLRDLMDEVSREGAHIYVLRYGKPIAVIVPMGWHEAVKEAVGIV